MLLRTCFILAIFSLFSTHAFAADWDGCYAGVNAGYEFNGLDKSQTTVPFGGITIKNSARIPYTSGAIGGSLGCDYQFSHLVVGPEFEGEYRNLRGATAVPGTGNATGEIVHSGVKSTYLVDEAIRVGWAQDNFLFFGKVGAVETTFKNTGYIAQTDGTPLDLLVTSNRASLGLLLGAGVEWALTDKLSVNAEYESMDYGYVNHPYEARLDYKIPGPVLPGTSRTKESEQSISFGLKYKFF